MSSLSGGQAFLSGTFKSSLEFHQKGAVRTALFVLSVWRGGGASWGGCCDANMRCDVMCEMLMVGLGDADVGAWGLTHFA